MLAAAIPKPSYCSGRSVLPGGAVDDPCGGERGTSQCVASLAVPPMLSPPPPGAPLLGVPDAKIYFFSLTIASK